MMSPRTEQFPLAHPFIGVKCPHYSSLTLPLYSNVWCWQFLVFAKKWKFLLYRFADYHKWIFGTFPEMTSKSSIQSSYVRFSISLAFTFYFLQTNHLSSVPGYFLISVELIPRLLLYSLKCPDPHWKCKRKELLCGSHCRSEKSANLLHCQLLPKG